MLALLYLLFDTKAAAYPNTQGNPGHLETLSLTTYDELAHTTAHKPLWPPAAAQADRPGTPTRAGATVEAGKLRNYLLAKKSPLADHAERILESEYWSTIIAIAGIEQQFCRIQPHSSPWNCWGLMRPGGGLQVFHTADDGIAAIHGFLERAETERGRPTIESFRGWYCYSATSPGHICPNWEPFVLKAKAEVESL